MEQSGVGSARSLKTSGIPQGDGGRQRKRKGFGVVEELKVLERLWTPRAPASDFVMLARLCLSNACDGQDVEPHGYPNMPDKWRKVLAL